MRITKYWKATGLHGFSTKTNHGYFQSFMLIGKWFKKGSHLSVIVMVELERVWLVPGLPG